MGDILARQNTSGEATNMSLRRNLLYSFLAFVMMCFLLQLTRLHAVTVHPNHHHNVGEGGSHNEALYSIMGYYYVDTLNDPCAQRQSLAISSTADHPVYSIDQALSLTLCRAFHMSKSFLWNTCQAIQSIVCDGHTYDTLLGRKEKET
jgi:hypothetical protein